MAPHVYFATNLNAYNVPQTTYYKMVSAAVLRTDLLSWIVVLLVSRRMERDVVHATSTIVWAVELITSVIQTAIVHVRTLMFCNQYQAHVCVPLVRIILLRLVFRGNNLQLARHLKYFLSLSR